MRTDDNLAAELAPPKRDKPICSQKLQVSLLPPFRRPEWPAKTTLARSAFLCAASPAACIPVLRRCAAAPSAVPNRRTMRFLIDTPAIRIQLNPLKKKHYIFSNRHSPQGLKLHTIRALRAALLLGPFGRRALISSAVAPRIVDRRMIAVLHTENFFEPSEPRWASVFIGGPAPMNRGLDAARRRND
jgi:hypothetical protein